MNENENQTYKSKDYVKDYNKNYYCINKAELLKKATVKLCCEYCGATIQKQHLLKHQRTKKCNFEKQNKLQNEEQHNLLKKIEELLNKTVDYTQIYKQCGMPIEQLQLAKPKS